MDQEKLLAKEIAERELGDLAKAQIDAVTPPLTPRFDIHGEPIPMSAAQIAGMVDGKVYCRLTTSTGSPIDGVFKRATRSSKFVVLFPSALPKDARLPFLPRWSWVDSIDANVWCFEEDLARRYGLVGGWFQEKTHFHADVIGNLIGEIASVIGVKNEDVTLTGSSLGGFGAMMAAPLFPGCLAIADVPQTDLAAYQHQSHIKDLCLKIYGSDDTDSVNKAHRDRFSVISRFRTFGVVPNILMLHELSDEPNGRQQVYNFLEGLGTLRKELNANFSVRCQVRCDGNGHAAMSKGEFIQLLSKEGRL